MKKYLLGTFAIVLAVGFSSFKAKTLTNTQLFYQLSVFDQTDVQSPSNWKTMTSPPTCDGGSVDACEIDVPSADVVGGTLKSTVTITATSSGTDYYVISTSDNATITNKN